LFRSGLAVVGLVGKTVRAVVVGRRCVAEAAVAVQGQAAVRGLAHQHRAQAVAVHVAVVSQNAGRGYIQGRVFGCCIAVVERYRRDVKDCDGDGDVGGGGASVGVVGVVVVGDGEGVVWRGCVGVGGGGVVG